MSGAKPPPVPDHIFYTTPEEHTASLIAELRAMSDLLVTLANELEKNGPGRLLQTQEAWDAMLAMMNASTLMRYRRRRVEPDPQWRDKLPSDR